MSDEARGKVFSEDTVAVLLMATGCTSISAVQYAMMSSLDGTRTAASFQHSFRSVLKKAKELKERVDTGENFEPVAPAKKRGGAANGATPPTTPKKPKTTPKTTPKATPKSRGKKGKMEASPSNDLEKEVELDKDMDVSFRLKEEPEDDSV